MGLTTEKAIAQHEREAQAQQAKRESELAWLLQADKSESERHAEHINSDEYKAYQAGLLTWHVEQARLVPTPGKGPGLASLVSPNETPDETSSVWRFLREYDGEGSLVFGPGAHPITGTPNSTPALTWDNYYKQKIIGSLDEMLLNANKYYVWNSSGTPEQLWGSPPALKPQESLNGKVPVVCADILILSYLDAGIDLSTSIIEFAKTDGGYTFPDYAPRNSVAIKNYLASQGVLNNFGQSNVPIGAGDMVFSVNAGHAGVVHTVIDPNDPSKIFVVQTSSSNATINKITLQEFHDGTVPTASISEVTYGHPQVP